MRYPSALAALIVVLVLFLLAVPKPTLAFDIAAFFKSLGIDYPSFSRSTPLPQPVIVSTPSQASPSVTPSPTLMPTPTPKPTIRPRVRTTAKPTTVSYQQKKDFIMKAINDYRKSKGLPAVKTDSHTCSFAKLRAQEITKSFNHNGFRDRINSKSLPYPGYSEVTENIAMNSNYQAVVQSWINSPGHAANMQKDTPFVCVEFSGNYYAYEGWRP